MKKKDLGLILVIAIISGAISILISGKIFSTPEDRMQTVEIAPAIGGDLNRPDSTYFNDDSINPAQNIEIGRDPNSDPFSGGQ